MTSLRAFFRAFLSILGLALGYFVFWDAFFLSLLLWGMRREDVLAALPMALTFGAVFPFLLGGGLAFLLLHLPALLTARLLLPKRFARFLPVVSCLFAAAIGIVLHRLYGPDYAYESEEMFWRSFNTSLLTAVAIGSLPSGRRLCRKQAPVTGVTAAVTAVVCLSGFAFYYFVCPGRYIEDAHGNSRADWLTGSVQACHGADSCTWETEK